MLGRKKHVKFHDERVLRVKRIRLANGREYYDFIVSLPREWVRRLLEERGISSPAELQKQKIKLRIEYDGNIVIKPVS